MSSSATATRPPSRFRLVALIREALSGEHNDYLTCDLNKAVLLLAIPMMLEMALESVFSVADIFWVGHLGPDSVAAVGLTESLLTVVLAVSSGLSTATTAVIARRIGEHDEKRAALDAVQSIFVTLLFSAAIAAPLFVFAPHLLRLLGASPHVAEIGRPYARITLGTSGIILLLSLNNAIFRGAGNAALAMRLLWIANLINLVLDPLLIFGVGPFPHLGIAGPAVATLIGRSCAVLYQFVLLLRGSYRIHLTRESLHLNLRELLRFIKVSSAGMFQFLLEQGSWLGITRIVSLFGAAAIAGYTIAFRIVGFAVLPALGLSNAAATLVGQHLGAQLPDRARSSVWRTALWNFAFLGSVSLILIVAAPLVISAFTRDPAARSTAVEGLRYFSLGNLFFAFGVVFLQAFNGAGDTITPSLINLGGLWLLEIPLAWLLSRHTGLHLRGIFIAVLGAQFVAVLSSGLLFLRGGWQKARLLED